jgi:EAL domain-containing protein (putative c-di-GMP-specific phosphodiesterase class I)
MQAALLLRQAIAHPVSIAGVDLVVGASFGIALLPVHGADPTVLLQHADVAMYAAKAAERPVVVYEPGFDDDSTRHLRLAADLRHALERQRLDVVFQPKIDLARDEVVGVEALSRWTHPVHGFISPDEFIPIAERTGLIVQLTQQVLRTSVEQCRIWRQRGMDIGVAVNLSLRGLLDDEFVAEIRDVLAENDVPARLLTLEITESSVMRDPDRTMPILHSLRDMGVRLSVDDFGTGYSSLAHLRRLPVHEVKVDKSFVLSMSTDPANAAIVRAVVDLGSTLGLNVVAEGVEDTHSRDALISMGCPTGQGYLFARPLSADRLDVWLAEHRIRKVLALPVDQASAIPDPRAF